MTLRHSLSQQWSKSILAHRLALGLQASDTVQPLFAGATSLSSMTITIAALVFSEGYPLWLPEMHSDENTPLTNELILHSLFNASRLLFIKEIEQGALNQAEHLVLTTAYQWTQSLQASSVQNIKLNTETEQLCQLIQTIYQQLEQMRHQKRQSTRNMGS
ncbi:hypothetical protein [Shewanella sp.]|uniref:hypothetical protein n=1 Tax=Shewanella sp. TaxID=50422 RepID=UPI003F3CD1E1